MLLYIHINYFTYDGISQMKMNVSLIMEDVPTAVGICRAHLNAFATIHTHSNQTKQSVLIIVVIVHTF